VKSILVRIVVGAGMLLDFLSVAGLVHGCVNLFHTTELSLVNIQKEAGSIRTHQYQQRRSPGKFVN
jgi:hypothetical protein